MKAVRVQYTVKKEYVEKNKENIVKVMNDLRQINNPGIKYSTFLLDNGHTFMHLAIFKNEEANRVFSEVESFKQFTAELKASEPVSSPKVENLTLVGASYDIF